jgi:RecB family exonuclease
VLALRWLARPQQRDGLTEALLVSDLGRLSPAAARGLVRAATANGGSPAAALDRRDGLTTQESQAVSALAAALAQADRVAGRSALDAFRTLWRTLPYSRQLVETAGSPEDRRDLDAVVALSQAVARAAERSDSRSTAAFLDLLEAGEGAPALAEPGAGPVVDAVNVLTAHATVGLEFDTVVVTGTVEGNFPSLSRPEPMFDLDLLRAPRTQSARNRLRLEDERRLFAVVAGRARRRVVFTASDPHGEGTRLSARSRFVAELGVAWSTVPGAPGPAEPLSVAEAAASWRRVLADPSRAAPQRMACIDGLLALGERPGRWWFQRDWTGSEAPLHDHLRVSFSKLDRLDNCALQFVLSEELGLEGAAGYQAWVGGLVHRLIEDCDKGLVERSPEGLAAEAERRWRPEQFPSRAVSEAYRRTVTKVMIPNWMAAYGGSPALERELHFEFEFEGATVSGYIDRVGSVQSGGTQIVDYKTGKSRNANADDSLQLGIYYLAVSRAEELARFRPVKAVELAFLKETRRDGGGPVLLQKGMNSAAQQEFGDRMAGRLSELIARLQETLSTEVYRPNPKANCRFCDFKTLCPLFPEGKELFPMVSRPAGSAQS